ncbi:Manganese/iron superoxide dismutase [Clohesyomyces aquaticus]|uniref:Manganese/iron superoxide dismutase n=1 Tax=Clohesyomyces aquaticus TaxID=1231657 RepID=A0A1Y1YDJ5_9PLEO|nr:Manganese/iron superoxide dismutase [Clohesyomyces aquaticus]
MIIRSFCRRPAAFQALAAAPARCSAAPSVRHIHHRPALANEADLVENGIPGLMSPAQFKIAWTDYQQHMMDQLNYMTAGTPFDNQSPKNLILEWARDPTKAGGFNPASMAWNNHAFFKGINTNPTITSRPSEALDLALTTNFSSLASLRETFLMTAESMFGPGFVWLVQQKENRFPFRILTTYIAGSPLSGAHYRRQSQDLNTENENSFSGVKNMVGSFGSSAPANLNPKKPLGGVDVVPLLCVNTWEHVWLHDYGVKGKSEYLARWWDRINWDEVAQYATLEKTRMSQNQFYG